MADSQPSTPQYSTMDVDLKVLDSASFSFGTHPSEAEAEPPTRDLVEEVLLEYDSLYSAGHFTYEDDTDTYSQFTDSPEDALDIDLAALRQFRESFEGYDEWHQQNSYVHYFENYVPVEEGVVGSFSTVDPHSPSFIKDPGDTLQSHTNAIQSALELAWSRPPPPRPEPSIFRNLEPYDTEGLPPDCFVLKKELKKKDDNAQE